MLLLIIILLINGSIFDKNECRRKINIIICEEIKFLPENLTIQENLIQENSQIAFFEVYDSFLQSIEDNYFANIDRNKNELTTIHFKNVKCLENLSTKSFMGIGEFLEHLHFINLPDLLNIDGDFFNSFVKLEYLVITSTKINWIPETILKLLTNIKGINISNNKLTKMPIIPLNNSALIKKFYGSGNPFDCVCSLMDFIRIMGDKLTNKNYYCETPIHLKNIGLEHLPDLCTTATKEMKNIKGKPIGLIITEIVFYGFITIVLLYMAMIPVLNWLDPYDPND